MGKALVLAAIILNVLTNASSAETLIANDVVYDTEAKDEPATLSCKIYLVITHSPEVVAFRLLFLFQKNPPTPIVGFNMDLGDMKFSDGKPTNVDRAPLQAAAFSSNTFSSPGRLNGGPLKDGGVMYTTLSSEDGRGFLSAFSKGQFDISFARKGSSFDRTYRVAEPPGADILQRFRKCISTAVN
jgi:hypothetical protein